MTRILVIDDEELARFAIREILERAGYDVIEAENGCDGLEKAGKTAFDLIVTDIIMPEKEGIETIVELRQLQPQLKVIAVSGGGRTRNFDFLEIAKQLGADATLAKPFGSDDLIGTVKRLLAS